MAQVEEHFQPNNLFNSIKKGKNLHRRTQSTNLNGFSSIVNQNQNQVNPNLMEEIAKQQGVSDTTATLKAVDASTKKQEEKHVTVEDINEIPKNMGWVIPKNPYSKNPIQNLKKRDFIAKTFHSNEIPLEPTKKTREAL